MQRENLPQIKPALAAFGLYLLSIALGGFLPLTLGISPYVKMAFLFRIVWLANPILLLAMVLLGCGVNGLARATGYIALFLGTVLFVGSFFQSTDGALLRFFPFWIPAYILWLSSMVVVIRWAQKGCDQLSGEVEYTEPLSPRSAGDGPSRKLEPVDLNRRLSRALGAYVLSLVLSGFTFFLMGLNGLYQTFWWCITQIEPTPLQSGQLGDFPKSFGAAQYPLLALIWMGNPLVLGGIYFLSTGSTRYARNAAILALVLTGAGFLALFIRAVALGGQDFVYTIGILFYYPLSFISIPLWLSSMFLVATCVSEQEEDGSEDDPVEDDDQ